MVERYIRDVEAGGSNPLTPTTRKFAVGVVLAFSRTNAHATHGAVFVPPDALPGGVGQGYLGAGYCLISQVAPLLDQGS